MSLIETNEKISEMVIDTYNKTEKTAINTYNKVSDFFINKFFTKDNESVEQAKARLKQSAQVSKLNHK